MRRLVGNGQNGWVLPTTLFGITLIMGTIRLLSLDATGVTRMYGDIRLSNTMRQHVMREVASMGEPKPLCETRTMNVDETKFDYEICGERRVPFMVAPPTGQLPMTRIDYDSLFMNALPCPSTPTNGIDARGNAVKASKDCPISSTLKGGVITVENLRGETTRVTATAAQPSIIASPGAITITGSLILESDLVLVAGGDIDIASITSLSDQGRKVTIISALGAIRVGSVSPGISLVAAGRSVLEVPETEQRSPFPMPPQRRHAIVGIRAVGG
jgi:hypothetical protein